MEQGRRFEQAVIVDLQQRWPVTRIATRPDEARSLAAAEATWDAMKKRRSAQSRQGCCGIPSGGPSASPICLFGPTFSLSSAPTRSLAIS